MYRSTHFELLAMLALLICLILAALVGCSSLAGHTVEIILRNPQPDSTYHGMLSPSSCVPTSQSGSVR